MAKHKSEAAERGEVLQRLLQTLNPNVPAGISGGMRRVAREAAAVRQLGTLVRADPNAKVLLTGHIGVGKSTELTYLATQLDEARVVIQCSVVDSLGIQNLNVFSLLVVVLEAAIAKWLSEFGELPPGLLAELVDHVRQLIPERKRPPKANAAFPALSQAAAAFAGLPTRITTGQQLRQLYSECIRRLALRYVADDALMSLDPTEMVASCEVLLKELAGRTERPVLLVIDDLDKILEETVQWSLFIDRAMAWRRLPCGLIATLPYDALLSERGAELDQIWGDVLVLDPLPMPLIDGPLSEPALNPYLSMLREAQAVEAISGLQCRRLAAISSGIPRTFVQLCSNCVLYAMQIGKTHVLDYHVAQAIEDLVTRWRARLSDDDYRAVVQVIDSGGSNLRPARRLVRDGVLIRNTSESPERQVMLAAWAQPLVEAYKRRQRPPNAS
jgi:hypothetical protein